MKTTFWQKVKERISSSNISDTWKMVRNVSGVIFTIGSLTLALPVTLPVAVTSWISWTVLATGVIAGRAQLNTGKKKTDVGK
jgi:hypothetical protein